LFAIYLDDITNYLSFGHIYHICRRHYTRRAIVIIIIIIIIFICMLQKLLDKFEQELNWIGMSINVKTSRCKRVGPSWRQINGATDDWATNFGRLGDTFCSSGRQSHNNGSRTETIPKYIHIHFHIKFKTRVKYSIKQASNR